MQNPKPIQMPCESPWDAIVQTGCLDIVEEDAFCVYCAAGSDAESPDPRTWPLERLRAALQSWENADRPLASQMQH